MNTLEFLSFLRDQEIRIWADGGRLRYNAPQGRLTPALRTELISRKEEILAILHTASVQLPPIRPVSRETNLPLSLGQERMWFLHQLEPESAAYTISWARRLVGPLDADILERSINDIISRHESLRTTFPVVDGTPVQAIVPSLELNLSVADLRHLEQGNREVEATRLAEQEARCPFDLERGPLLRATLLRLDDTDHILLLAVHHIVSDAWSMGVLSRDLAAFYEARCAGRQSQLPELKIQYADFAVWQRQWLEGKVRKEHLTYWKQQLGGKLSVLELPTDHPRPSVQTYRGSSESDLFGEDSTEALKKLSAEEGATLFMTLLAAFKVLLCRYTGQRDLIVGSPVSGRDLPEVEGLIGFFLNTLILRTDLSDDPGFRELLRRVRETVLEAFAHQVIPFEELLRELQPERSLSHTPLFQVLLVFHDPSEARLSLPGVTATRLKARRGTTQFELSLIVRHSEQGLRVGLQYNTDLFDASTIARMLGHFRVLLQGIIDDPDQPISRLPLLTKSERQQLLSDWNSTHTGFPLHRCFHELFEEQVERTPDRVAVICAGAEQTYRQLNSRSNRLARLLVEKGVGSDVVVAVLDERGIDLLTAFIAILKAGGAYLPLDPRHPAQRHRQVLVQSRAALILTRDLFVPTLSEALEPMASREKPGILQIEQIDQLTARMENLPRRCSPDDLAYVIYTSGSTGLPKGAMVEHRGMLNHLFAKISDLELTGADLVAQNASQTFDISVWQFLAALLLGGRVCIFPDEVAYDPHALLHQVAEQRISIFETVPSVLRLMLDEVADSGSTNSDLPALRWLIPTGEALPPELARQWLSHYPNIPLLNAYGPTECSDDVTHYPIHEPPAADVLNMPIGRPIANMRMYILDAHLQPVPIGVPGELCVAGIGVGRGYLNDPGRTAEVFLADPFSSDPDARLYRTGDLVRYLPDGNIEFLGRLDYQVKIRGFRIELGEIETTLGSHPKIREAVVLVTKNLKGDERLAAYVVSEGEEAPDASDLRSYLREKLPDYMVPTTYQVLDALPLTRHGKVDRQALPQPDWSRSDVGQVYVAPRTPVEEVLASIFCDVLGLDQVGIHDSFFDLGGHSLLAARIINRTREILMVEVPLVSLFEAPTVAELSGKILALEPQAESIARTLMRIRHMSAGERQRLLDHKKA